MLDDQLYSAQYSGVGVDPVLNATTQAGLQPQLYGQTTEAYEQWDSNLVPYFSLASDRALTGFRQQATATEYSTASL